MQNTYGTTGYRGMPLFLKINFFGFRRIWDGDREEIGKTIVSCATPVRSHRSLDVVFTTLASRIL